MDKHLSRMPQRRLRRALLSTVVFTGLMALFLAAPTLPAATDASWTDSEYAQATLAGAVISPPTMDTCSLNPGLFGLSPVVTITWHFPAGGGYSPSTNVGYAVAQGGLGATQVVVSTGGNLSTSGPSSGEYTTKYQSGLFSGLLGGSYGIFVRTLDDSAWSSTQASALASMALLGLNPRCVIS
jgi:hypothetical protein